MSSPKSKFRTTLSVEREIWEALERQAERDRMSPMDAARAALAQYVELGDSETAALQQAAAIVRDVRRIGPRSNPYLDFVASWRIGRTAEQVQGLANSAFELDMWPAQVYLVNVLRDLLRNFGEQDEFLVITNLKFWEQFGPPGSEMRGEANRYLQAQQDAVERGMRLLRIFLLDETDDDLDQHAEFAESCKTASEFVQVKAMRFSSAEFKLARDRFGHFACIRRRKDHGLELPSPEPDLGSLVVEPVAPFGRITRLRFVFSRGPSEQDPAVHRFVTTFMEAARSAKPLKDLVSPMPGGKGGKDG